MRRDGRLAALLLILLGTTLAVLPAFSWYSVPRAGGDVTASGFSGAGQLLLIPALGGLVVFAGGAIVGARRSDRPAPPWTGPVALAAGALGLVFSIWAVAAPRVELRATFSGGTEVVPTPVDVASAGVVSIVIAVALVVVASGVTWSGRPR